MSLLKFQIDYHTNFGEELFVCGSIPELGGMDESKALKLSYADGLWTSEIKTTSSDVLRYYYFLSEHGNITRREWGSNRRLQMRKNKNFIVRDSWKNKPYHSYLYSSVFTKSVFAHEKNHKQIKYTPNSILVNVICPYVKKGEYVAICGNNYYLGNWETEKSLPLSYVGNSEWQIILNAQKITDGTNYKFVILNKDNKQVVHWEDGENRILSSGKNEQKNTVLAEMALQYHYDNFSYKGTGTTIPVFSLKSDDSFGIGDFYDLRKMIDWASITGQQIIQMLPINDTTTTHSNADSYPYSAISIYALHPIYLGLKEFPLKEAKMKSYLKAAKKLNDLPVIDYENTLKLKTNYTKDLFAQEGAAILASPEYKTFCEKNKFWLFSYACYCYLRDKFGTAHFRDWGEYAVYDELKLEKMIRENDEAKQITDFHCFVQFLLDKQLSSVQQYAHTKGVALKGDIPIGINRDSIDAWTSPHLFNMDTQTGAPPDDFSFFGQNWGFPTYNWFAMEKEGYAWWKNRFRKMADYFDAYRIDHILGFFRIWEIPMHSMQGLLGHFRPALPYWAEELHRAGIPFDEERMAKPFIHEGFLPDIFGENTPEVIEKYLNVSGWQLFSLKHEYNTQHKIQGLFWDKTDEKNLRIRDGLYALCNEVLFVKDRIDHNKYHPRITAQYTYSYGYLPDEVKNAFNRLYDDFYYHRHNYFWREQAMKKLPALISSTSMLVCGEDLGMVPDCVPSVMNELQILSLEIQRMPKDPKTVFSDLNSLPYLSVCTTSTHDMSPIRLWWPENKDLTQRYYNEILYHEGEAPDECSPGLCAEILQKHLDSSAMWVVLPWQDWMSVSEELRRKNAAEERINIPADPHHYWCYRMHISLDNLLKETEFNQMINDLSQR